MDLNPTAVVDRLGFGMCHDLAQICAICQDETPHVGRTAPTSLDERGRLPSLRMGGFLEHHPLVDDAPIQKIIYKYIP